MTYEEHCDWYAVYGDPQRDAMDYEIAAEHDRWEGWGDPAASREVDFPEGPIRISLPVIEPTYVPPDYSEIPF